jgi:small subunit ribosomal protein S6
MSALTLKTEKIVRPYEVIIIMHPDATEETQKALFKKNKEIIQQHNGSVNHVDSWGKRTLANPIGKTRKGLFFHATFTADNKAVAELERTMRINESVLRFGHTRLEDGTNLTKFLEDYKQSLADGVAREKEREAKMQAKKAARSQSSQQDRNQDRA